MGSSANPLPPAVGDTVTFWTGRGSHGTATVRAIEGDRYLLDPTPDAVKGSDFLTLAQPSRRTGSLEFWHPRDTGVRLANLKTPPRIWYTNY